MAFQKILLVVSTTSGWLGAYSAMAALLSLIITMWPFVAAAGDKVRHVGDPTQKLGLKRAAGWFALANLACLVGSVAGRYIAQAWDALVPLVNDPIFQLSRQAWAIPLDLLPFFVFSVLIETMVLWGMNLTPPRPERVRRGTLALLALGQNVLTYLLAGLVMWEAEIPRMGGYDRVRTAGEVRDELSASGQRIWYIAPGGDAVRSVRPDGSGDRLAWAGPVPRPYSAMWLVDSPLDGRRLVFVHSNRLSIVELKTGRLTSCPAGPTTQGETGPRAGAPATPGEMARVLGVPGGWIWPGDPCRSPAGDEGLTPSMVKEARKAGGIDQENWLRRHGEGRALPTVPTRPAWRDQQDIQPMGPDLIVANYGYRLVAFNPYERWLAALGLSAEGFVITPESPSDN